MREAPISDDRHIMELEQREDDPGDAKSGSPTKKSGSSHCMRTRSNRCPLTVTGKFLLPSSSSLLLLAAVIFAAFASSSSSLAHATVTTTMSDLPEEVGETASAWSGGSSRSIKEDKLLDEDELPASSSSRRVNHMVLKLREENRAGQKWHSNLVQKCRTYIVREAPVRLPARWRRSERSQRGSGGRRTDVQRRAISVLRRCSH